MSENRLLKAVCILRNEKKILKFKEHMLMAATLESLHF